MSRLVSLFALVLATACAVGPAWAEGPGHPVRIAGHPAYPPAMLERDERLTGVAPDIARRIFTDLGMGVEELTGLPWGRVLQYAEDGKVDFVAGLFMTKDREDWLVYVPTPVMRVREVLFTRRHDGLPPGTTLDDLVSVRLGVLTNEGYAPEYEAFLKEHGHELDIVELPSLDHALRMLTQDRIDCFWWGQQAALLRARELGLADQVRVISGVGFAVDIHFGFSRLSPHLTLVPAVDKLLRKYASDGTIRALLLEQMHTMDLPTAP